MQQNIIPCLWFDGTAKEAVEFYISVFPNSKIINTEYYPHEGLLDFQEKLAGKELTIEFDLNGNRFTALNAGPEFKFNEAVSFVVPCKDQEEIDYYWYKLIAGGGKESMCGWCKDKFGLSWQVVPTILGELMSNPENGQRVVQAFMKMRKFDIEALQNA